MSRALFFHRPAALAGLLFALAFLIRLVGIGWGLPNELHDWSYHPDEPTVWAASQQGVVPGFYNYGTLYLTVLNVASAGVAAYGGAPESPDPRAVARYIGRCHLAGRVLSALAGAGTVAAVFLLLWRHAGLLAGAAGGGLIAVAPGHVVHSRFQTVDVFAAFLLSLSVLFALRLVLPREAEGDVRDAALAGLFAGLSAGTKYTGILVLLTLYAAIVLGRRDSWLRLASVGTAAAVVAFAAATPGAWLDTRAFLRDFVYEMRHTASGHGFVFTATPPGYVYHLTNLFAGIGILATMLGLAGLIGAGVRRHAWAIALLAFCVPYYLVIGGAEVKFLRYTFPLYVGIAAGFGWVVRAAHRRGGTWKALVAVGIVGLGGESSLGGLRGAATYSAWMAGEEPRDRAGRELRKLAQRTPGAAVGVISDPWFYTAAIYPEAGMPRPQYQRLGAQAMAGAIPRVVRLGPGSVPEYATASSLEIGDLARLERLGAMPPEAAPRWSEIKGLLRERYAPVATYGGGAPRIHDLEYVRPEVYLWKRNDLP